MEMFFFFFFIVDEKSKSMKKRSRLEKQDPKESKDKLDSDDKKNNGESDDTFNNQGFSDWLSSSNGIEMMKLFVIANSILVFVTVGWPNIQNVASIVRDYIRGEENNDDEFYEN